MSKKILIGLAPILAAAAFAAMPAMASARTTYGTEAGGVFTAFTEFKHEAVISKKAGAAPFVLENEAKTADIECSSFAAAGFVWNVGGVGHSHFILVFDGCKGSGALAGCEINPKTNHEIEGTVTDEVLTETTVKVTIESGFNVKCLKEGVEEELGNVTGSVTGTQTAKTAILKFAKATGLTFLGMGATISGEDETETTPGGKKVII